MNWRHHHSNRPPEPPTSTLYLVTAPSDPLVTPAQMRKQMNLSDDFTADDDWIETAVMACVQHLDGRDGILGRALADQTWQLKLSWFPPDRVIDIPLPPLIEVISIDYTDADGVTQEFDAANYIVTGVGDRGKIYLGPNASWPVLGVGYPERVSVEFRCGYIDSSVSPATVNVPKPIIQSIKMLASTMYANREHIVIGQTAIVLPWAVEQMLAPYRVFR